MGLLVCDVGCDIGAVFYYIEAVFGIGFACLLRLLSFSLRLFEYNIMSL